MSVSFILLIRHVKLLIIIFTKGKENRKQNFICSVVDFSSSGQKISGECLRNDKRVCASVLRTWLQTNAVGRCSTDPLFPAFFSVCSVFVHLYRSESAALLMYLHLGICFDIHFSSSYKQKQISYIFVIHWLFHRIMGTSVWERQRSGCVEEFAVARLCLLPCTWHQRQWLRLLWHWREEPGSAFYALDCTTVHWLHHHHT